MSADINWDSELKWRPGSYADFDDPVALVLNGIRGQMRREMARYVCVPVDRPERLVAARTALDGCINHRAIGVVIENATAVPVPFRQILGNPLTAELTATSIRTVPPDNREN